MDPAQGFAAQAAGAAVILSASHVGFPLSTTHVMTGAIMGAGAAKRLSAVRWGVAGNIADRLGAHAAGVGGGRRPHLRASSRLFGAHEAGPIVVSAHPALARSTAAFVRRIATGRTLTAEG